MQTHRNPKQRGRKWQSLVQGLVRPNWATMAMGEITEYA